MEKNKDVPIETGDNKVIIKTSNLVKDYEIGEFIVRAVDDVNLEMKEGDFIAIKGPSGAGKTTLLNLLGGLDRPSEGEIFSFGVRISDMSQETLTVFRLMNSGFIFQDFNLISTLTAEENVMFPMSLLDVELKRQREVAVKLLKEVGLGKRREHLPSQLSAGEKQRVAIARALANDPPLILADEPTANLDQKTVLVIQEFFKRLKKINKTVIIATHDDFLLDIADRILTFEEGQIINGV